jgi:SAM-dependent methyltransferase
VNLLRRIRRSIAFRLERLRRRRRKKLAWEDRWKTGEARGAHWVLDDVLPETLVLLDGHPPGARVAVGLGCGAGTTLAALAERFPVALGLDLAPSATALARTTAPGSVVAVAKAPRLPLRDASVDFFHDRGCFHLLGPELQHQYLDELRRVLGVGGMAQLVERRQELVDLEARLPVGLVIESEVDLPQPPGPGGPPPMSASVLRRA